ncbi:hypothetical protein [Pseudoclavibacter helvolus]|nr:hypothetical protein [Pseudoclavibacter helvolus]
MAHDATSTLNPNPLAAVASTPNSSTDASVDATRPIAMTTAAASAPQ